MNFRQLDAGGFADNKKQFICLNCFLKWILYLRSIYFCFCLLIHFVYRLLEFAGIKNIHANISPENVDFFRLSHCLIEIFIKE